MDLFEKLTAKARAHRQRIVLPEGLEPRTLTAADRIIADGLADIILIGNPTDIYTLADSMKLSNIRQATIVDPADEKVIDKYAPLSSARAKVSRWRKPVLQPTTPSISVALW